VRYTAGGGRDHRDLLIEAIRYLSVVNCVQIERESEPTICDSICSQQTLKIHKNRKPKEFT